MKNVDRLTKNYIKGYTALTGHVNAVLRVIKEEYTEDAYIQEEVDYILNFIKELKEENKKAIDEL